MHAHVLAHSDQRGTERRGGEEYVSVDVKVGAGVGMSAADHVARQRAEEAAHHLEVLDVVVGLEERLSGQQLHQDAAETPHVAWIAPAEAQNHLRRAVMPRADHRRVVLLVEPVQGPSVTRTPAPEARSGERTHVALPKSMSLTSEQRSRRARPAEEGEEEEEAGASSRQ
jgi:hypothetical protein